MILNMMNEIGKRKLDTKSTIWASSRDGGGAGAGVGVGAGGGDGGICTTGDECWEAAEIDTAESTCNELLLYGSFVFELFGKWFDWINDSNASLLWCKLSCSFLLYAFKLANRLPMTRTFSLLFMFWSFCISRCFLTNLCLFLNEIKCCIFNF